MAWLGLLRRSADIDATKRSAAACVNSRLPSAAATRVSHSSVPRENTAKSSVSCPSRSRNVSISDCYIWLDGPIPLRGQTAEFRGQTAESNPLIWKEQRKAGASAATPAICPLQRPQHRLGARDVDLSRLLFDVERFNDAVVDQHRIALRADAEAAF